ncbi:hypothetical protein [Solicola sp. PLA-1-18]|uniref:hypothetical protein n=1 Tax=Solicola sp. PLA-1-18 TaxID=3380532 RepID=UPI003B78B1C3
MAKKSKKSEDKQVKVAVKKAVKSERKKLTKAVQAAEEAAARAEKAAAKAAGRAKSAKKASKKVSKKAAPQESESSGLEPVDAGESIESVAPEATPLQNVAQDAQLSDASAKVAGDPLGSASADTETPADDPHVGLTRAQLVVLAGERGVPNRSRLTKAQLLEALRSL